MTRIIFDILVRWCPSFDDAHHRDPLSQGVPSQGIKTVLHFQACFWATNCRSQIGFTKTVLSFANCLVGMESPTKSFETRKEKITEKKSHAKKTRGFFRCSKHAHESSAISSIGLGGDTLTTSTKGEQIPALLNLKKHFWKSIDGPKII